MENNQATDTEDYFQLAKLVEHPELITLAISLGTTYDELLRKIRENS